MRSDRTTPVGSPVYVTDNGVRSFIPPTFCFELRDESANLVATVSQIVLAPAGLTDFDALEVIRRDGLWATGFLSAYEAGPQARVPGARFTIQNTGSGPRT